MREDKMNILKVAFPTFIGERFFIECSDGWFDLIADIAQYVTNKTVYCSASQIKEKFGTLRVYINFEYDENGECLVPSEMSEQIYKYISRIESMSNHICEDCGMKLTEGNKCPQEKLGYWIRNICVPCNENQENEVARRLENKIYKTLKEQ